MATVRDFGLARILGKEADARSAVDSAGTCLYELATGREPYGERSGAVPWGHRRSWLWTGFVAGAILLGGAAWTLWSERPPRILRFRAITHGLRTNTELAHCQGAMRRFKT